MKAFIEGMLYTVNTFYRAALTTQVLRDEDISFPPTTDFFSNKAHPILRDLTLQGILEGLNGQANSEFAPYLSWMASLVMTTAWTMEPKEIEFMKSAAATGASTGGGKNKKKKKAAASVAATPVLIEQIALTKMTESIT